jgi:hypothetical protein
MKTLFLNLLLAGLFTNSFGQSSAILDSLRYYPINEYAHFTTGVQFGSVFMYSKNQFSMINHSMYAVIDFATADSDVQPFPNSYERIDSTTGIVYRHVNSIQDWPDSRNTLYSFTNPYPGSLYGPFSLSSDFKDSTEFPIERLFFEQQPHPGDTINLGGARFTGFQTLDIPFDSVKSDDIVVLFKGYRELTDTQLEFDLAADTLIQLIDFEIRYKHNSDRILSYTFAKDIGLIEVNFFYYPNKEDKPDEVVGYVYKLFDTKVNGRHFKRDHLHVANEPRQHFPQEFELSAYPNPFNPSTTIRYTLNVSSEIKLAVYNVLGQPVQFLEQGFKSVGSYSIAFDATHLSSGMYLVQLQTPLGNQLTKIVLIK